MAHYFVAGHLWLLAAFAVFIGKNLEHSGPTEYSVFGSADSSRRRMTQSGTMVAHAGFSDTPLVRFGPDRCRDKCPSGRTAGLIPPGRQGQVPPLSPAY